MRKFLTFAPNNQDRPLTLACPQLTITHTTMRSLPPVIKNLLIINLLVFVASQWVLPRIGVDLHRLCGLHFFMAPDFRPWQFVTYMFLHGNLEHILFNMFALWMFGRIIEATLEMKRFIIFYFVCGIGAGVVQEIVQYIHYTQLDIVELKNLGQMVTCVRLDDYPVPVTLDSYLNAWNCVGASGAIYGILLAFGMYYPNERMFIIPIPVPIKAKYFVLGYAVIELMSTLTSANDGVGHAAHLGGMIFAFLLIIYWRHNDNKRRSGAQFISFDSYYKNY